MARQANVETWPIHFKFWAVRLTMHFLCSQRTGSASSKIQQGRLSPRDWHPTQPLKKALLCWVFT